MPLYAIVCELPVKPSSSSKYLLKINKLVKMVNKRGSELGLKDLDFVSSIFHYSEPHSSSA